MKQQQKQTETDIILGEASSNPALSLPLFPEFGFPIFHLLKSVRITWVESTGEAS